MPFPSGPPPNAPVTAIKLKRVNTKSTLTLTGKTLDGITPQCISEFLDDKYPGWECTVFQTSDKDTP